MCVGVFGTAFKSVAEPDTSKPNVDPWVQLVLVGVDTKRQMDPIKKAMMADRPGRLTPFLLTPAFFRDVTPATLLAGRL